MEDHKQKETSSSSGKSGGGSKKSNKVMGVEFAPINLPWQRRAQTAAVMFWFFIFFICSLGGYPATFALVYFTKYGWIFLFYFIWLIVDKQCCNRGGRKINAIRSCVVWKYYRDYFPIKLVKTADFDPKKNYLIGNHPHGILCTGAFTAFGTEALDVSKLFPGMRFHLLTLEINFMFPILRDIILGFGTLAATRKGMNYLLSRKGGGEVGVLIPGGAPESLDSHPGSYIVQLNRRKGFIKVAMQNGASLVPSISFGEPEIYDQVPNPEGSFIRTIQDKLQNALQIAPAAFLGRGIFQYSFGWLPMRKPITVVVGTPIDVEKVSQPTQEQIDILHQTYVDALVDLFYAHREKYALDPSHVIRIV